MITIPTSAGRADRVGTSVSAALRAARVADLARRVTAIETPGACQALDLLGLTPSAPPTRMRARVGEIAPTLATDRVPFGDIDTIAELIASRRPGTRLLDRSQAEIRN